MPMRPTHSEDHLIDRIGWLRAVVLGANDGLIAFRGSLSGPSQTLYGRPVSPDVVTALRRSASPLGADASSGKPLGLQRVKRYTL
ncbi:hypothetical protein ASG52_24320 [Methylobacterium sp. Leaf456]|nr:hypothetical protein ASG52_24320 [Methylobacterium sp. Leaf456]